MHTLTPYPILQSKYRLGARFQRQGVLKYLLDEGSEYAVLIYFTINK